MDEDHSLIEFHKPPSLSTTKKVLYVASSFVILFAIGFMLLVIFWLLYPYKTVEIDEPIKVLNPNHEISVGQNIVLEVSVTKDIDVQPTRSEFITCDDGSLTFIDPGSTRNVPKGTFTIINDQNKLPAKLLPGSTCRYHFRYGYKVNPIREIVKEWTSDNFLVVGGEGSGNGS